MCILLVSTIHPEYPFILLFNRDEFLSRPTARASWWDPQLPPSTTSSPSSSSSTNDLPPHPTSILSGRDLVRSTHGTWLGITASGRLSALTNILEPADDAAHGVSRSRGEAPVLFLNSDEPTGEWIARTESEDRFEGVGGLSLFCTTLSSATRREEQREEEERRAADSEVEGEKQESEGKAGSEGVERAQEGEGVRTELVEGDAWVKISRTPQQMAIISNGPLRQRLTRTYTTSDVSSSPTFGMSNSQSLDNPWPKVPIGTSVLSDTLKNLPPTQTKDELLDTLFGVLKTKGHWPDDPYDVRVKHLKNSVFVPEMLWHEHILDGEFETNPFPASEASKGVSRLSRTTTPPPGNAGGAGDGCLAGAVQMSAAEEGEVKDILYGTKEQTVMLVDRTGHVTVVERTLHDGERWLVGEERDRRFEWDLEG